MRQIEKLRTETVPASNSPTRAVEATELSVFVDEFRAGLSQFLDTKKTGIDLNRLANALRFLDGLQERHAKSPVYRPNVAQHIAVESTLQNLAGLWPIYREALTTPSASLAKELAKQGQGRLDSAANDLARLSDLKIVADKLQDSSVPSLLERALNALRVSHPHQSLLEVAASGADEARAFLGSAVDDSHGLQYLLLRTVADVHFDPTRFARSLKQATKFCLEAEGLRNVTEQPEALERLGQTQRAHYEALVAFEAIIARVDDDAVLIRRIMRFYAELYEEVGAPLFAWYNLLSGQKSQPFSKLIRCNATDLAKSLHRSPIADFFAGTQPHLRNATSHSGGYTVVGDAVQFNLGSFNEVIPRDQVINDVFAFLESLSVTNWALSNALALAGIDVPLSEDDARLMNIGSIQLAEMFLRERGLAITNSADEAGAWVFRHEDGAADVFMPTLALATSASAEKATAVAILNDATTPISLNRSDYKRYAEVSSGDPTTTDSLFATLHLRRQCFVGRESLLNEADLNFAVACLGAFLLSPDSPDLTMTTHLRRLLDLATETKFTRPALIVRRVMREFRLGDSVALDELRHELLVLLQHSPQPAIPSSCSVRVHQR